MDRHVARRPGMPPDVHDEDEIEILEVVGLEDAPDLVAEADAPEDEDEIVLDFSDGVDRGRERPGTGAGRATVDLERFIRLQADFENLRKRTDRERDEHLRYAAAALVERLLPVLDNLERALSVPTVGTNESALREGLVLVHRQFFDELSRSGLRRIPSVGEAFDPLIHEAVETAEAGDVAPNTVVMELQRGYWFHDRVLRPALVRVAVDPTDQESSGEGGEEG